MLIQKINEKQNIFGDEIGFIEHWDFSKANLNEENRIKAITQVASICYQNPKALGSESLYNRLMAESMGLPSSSFEFVPVLLQWGEVIEVCQLIEDTIQEKDENGEIIASYIDTQTSNIEKYGEWIEVDGCKYLLTNFRAIVYDFEQYGDRGVDLRNRYNTLEECEIIKQHFKVFLFKVDLPTRSQMVRHRVCWQELCISGESKITTLQGKRTIKELYENQFRKSPNKLPKVRTYDFNEKRLVWSEIKEVFSTGKKPVFEVVIQTGVKGNKLRIKATENHKFLTLDGWKELKDISVSGFVATNGKIHSDKTREKISQKLAKPLGETALGFRFRIHSYWMADFRRSKILETFNNKCARCQTEDLSNVELDHIKPVRLYPNLAFEESNIQPLCKKCHVEKTLEENKLNDHTYTFNFVESITLIGEEDTYDLEVEHPDHNYVANGIIVHNSRRYVSGERVPFEFYISDKMGNVTSTAEKEIWFEKDDGSESTRTGIFNQTTQSIIDDCLAHYKQALKQGVKPQEARRIIPQAAYSQIWGAFQPKQLDNYFKLRLDEHSQWEIRQTAIAMQELINA